MLTPSVRPPGVMLKCVRFPSGEDDGGPASPPWSRCTCSDVARTFVVTYFCVFN